MLKVHQDCKCTWKFWGVLRILGNRLWN